MLLPLYRLFTQALNFTITYDKQKCAIYNKDKK